MRALFLPLQIPSHSKKPACGVGFQQHLRSKTLFSATYSRKLGSLSSQARFPAVPGISALAAGLGKLKGFMAGRLRRDGCVLCRPVRLRAAELASVCRSSDCLGRYSGFITRKWARWTHHLGYCQSHWPGRVACAILCGVISVV